MVTVAAAAGVLALVTAPAGAAPQQEGPGKPVTSIPGLKLIPAKKTAKSPRIAGAQDETAYFVQNAWSGRCLDADPATIGTNGTVIRLWDCSFDNPAANQLFFVTLNPQGFYRFQSVADGRYLDASAHTPGGFANGTKIQLWDFVAGGQNQWWSVTQNPQGFLRFQTPVSNRYLDASLHTPGGGVNGTKVQLWDFVPGGQNQWWD
jgi:hypothetical protein